MTEAKNTRVCIVGAGLSGCDAAYFLAQKGVDVILVESKKLEKTPAQTLESYGELVCTNSLKSMDPNSGHGLLKSEMHKMGSLILDKGHECKVPAGGALAVDREMFSKAITKAVSEHPNIKIVERLVGNPLSIADEFDCFYVIQATGPLPVGEVECWLNKNISEGELYFYDAIAPIVDADSLDLEKLYFKDRHQPIGAVDEAGDLIEPDYLNAAMDKEQYEAFMHELVKAEKVLPKNFEKPQFFEACLPIDLMAERGIDTPRHGCMKPIGLERSETEKRSYAVVQLRKENLLGSAYNLVGFQTRLTYKEQNRIFKMIPGFENASFLHLGSVHRNTYLHSKKYLDFDMSSKKFPRLHFAGQMTGVEGYTESAASGLYVASQVLRKINGKEKIQWPKETALGALINYVMTCETPRPSNINFGLLPPVEIQKKKGMKLKRFEWKKLKKELAAQRAREVFSTFWDEVNEGI